MPRICLNFIRSPLSLSFSSRMALAEYILSVASLNAPKSTFRSLPPSIEDNVVWSGPFYTFQFLYTHWPVVCFRPIGNCIEIVSSIWIGAFGGRWIRCPLRCDLNLGLIHVPLPHQDEAEASAYELLVANAIAPLPSRACLDFVPRPINEPKAKKWFQRADELEANAVEPSCCLENHGFLLYDRGNQFEAVFLLSFF